MQSEGQILKEQILNTINENNKSWVVTLREYIENNVSSGASITGEDIRILYLGAGYAPPKHYNSWGAAINSLIRFGTLTPTNEFRASAIKTSHAHKSRVYICNN